MTLIELEHPHGNADRDQGGAHPTQTVPEREQGWQNPRQLQERYRNVEDHPAEGHQHEPEHPTPTAQDTDHHDGEKHPNAHQQECCGRGRAPCRRGHERERVRVDGWCSNVDHHQQQCSQEKKSQERPLQATGMALRWHVHRCPPSLPPSLPPFLVAPAQCKRCSSRSSSRSTRRSVSSSMRPWSRKPMTAARSAASTSRRSCCWAGSCPSKCSSPAPSMALLRVSSF